MDPETQQLLDEGIALLRIGNKEEARQKLMQVINADERNEYGWLYLSEAVESDEDRQICLENALTINPTNERAETELRTLQQKMAQAQAEAGGLVCPTCGATNPVGSQRCFSCYAEFDQAIPAPPAPVFAEQAVVGKAPTRQVQHKSFMEMLDTWAEMLALPKKARLDEEHVYARWGLVIPGILVASGITYFFVVLTNVGTTLLLPGSALNLGKLLPIACGGAVGGAVAGLLSFFISSGLYYLFARILQGKGEFVVQSYLLSLVYSPVSLVFGIISPLMLLSAVKPVLGFVPAVILLPVSILAVMMTVRALKSAHGYGTGGALGTLFLPAIVYCCIGALLFVLLGKTLTTTLPFTLSDFQ
jgi:protein-arginine kinase activator protein McsA